MISDTAARAVIDKEVRRAGTQKAFAIQAGLSTAYVNDVVNGRKAPSKAILDVVGLERVVMYRRKSKAA